MPQIRIDQPVGMRERNAGHNRPRRDGAGQDSTSDKGASAGPEMTPSGLKREPWHGQSQVRSASFHATRQPICVQVAEHTVSVPFELDCPTARPVLVDDFAFSPSNRAQRLMLGADDPIARH